MPGPRLIQGFLTGGTTTAPNAGQVLAVMCVAEPAMIRTVIVATDGASNAATVFDLLKNGVSVWASAAQRPQIASGSPKMVLARLPDKRALQPGDLLRLVVVSSGNNVGVAATAVLEYPESQP